MPDDRSPVERDSTLDQDLPPVAVVRSAAEAEAEQSEPPVTPGVEPAPRR